MRCIVINMANASERRKAIQEQFDKVNLAYELWPATESLTPEQIQMVDHRKRANSGLYPIDMGALACLMSHFSVLRDLTQSRSDMVAVFEDDAILHTDLPEFFKALENKSHKFDIIMLQQNTKSKPYYPIYQVTTSHTMGRIRYADWGAYGYVITRTAASHILKRFPHPVYEIDLILPRFWINGLRNVMWVNPPLVFHNDLFPSQIENSRRPMIIEHRLKVRHSPILLFKRYWSMIKQTLVRRNCFRQLRKQDCVIDPFSF